MNPKQRLREGVLQQILKSLVIKGKELDARFRIDRSDRSWIRCKNDGVSWDTALNLIALIEKYAAERGVPGPIIQVADFEEAPEIPLRSKDIKPLVLNLEKGTPDPIVQVDNFKESEAKATGFKNGNTGHVAVQPPTVEPQPEVPLQSKEKLAPPPVSKPTALIRTSLPTANPSEYTTQPTFQRSSRTLVFWSAISALVFIFAVYSLLPQSMYNPISGRPRVHDGTQVQTTLPVPIKPQLVSLHSETQCGTHLFEPNKLFQGFKSVRTFLQDPFRNYDEPFAEVQEHLTEVPNETGTAPIRYALDDLEAIPQFYPCSVRCSFHKRAYIAVIISAQYETENSNDEQHVYYAICNNTDDPSIGKEFEFNRFPKTTSFIERRPRVGMRYNVTAVVFPIEEADADTNLTLTLIPPP